MSAVESMTGRWSLRRRTAAFLAAATGIVGGALALRLHGLTRHGFWLDELMTWHYVARPKGVFLSGLRHQDAAMAFYLCGLWLWRHMSDATAWLRLPSVLGGTLVVAATIDLARRIAGRRAALLAGLLVAVSPPMIRYSQELRSYAITTCLAVLATTALLAVAKPDASRRQRAWYVLAIALMVGSQQLSVSILASHMVALVIARVPVRRWMPTVATALVASVPLVALLNGQGSNASWIDPLSWDRFVVAVRIIGPVLLLGLAAVTLLWWATRRSENGGLDLGRAAVACGALVPWALVAGVSVVRPLLVDRYLLVTAPFLAAGLAGAAFSQEARARRVASVALRVAGAVGCAWLLVVAYQWRSAPGTDNRFVLDHSAALRAVDRRVGPCDRIVYSSVFADETTSYYIRWRGAPVEYAAQPDFDTSPCPGGSLWIVGIGPETDHVLAQAAQLGYVVREELARSPHLDVVRLTQPS